MATRPLARRRLARRGSGIDFGDATPLSDGHFRLATGVSVPSDRRGYLLAGGSTPSRTQRSSAISNARKPIVCGVGFGKLLRRRRGRSGRCRAPPAAETPPGRAASRRSDTTRTFGRQREIGRAVDRRVHEGRGAAGAPVFDR